MLPLADPSLPPDPLFAVNASLVAAPNARAVELEVELPLGTYEQGVGGAWGQLPVQLDLEQQR